MAVAYNERIKLLFEGSLKAIPFNIILAGLLSVALYCNKAPHQLVIFWFLAIIFSSFCRWFFCRFYINKISEQNEYSLLFYFNVLTFFMGSIWGACYLIMLPYISILQEFIIILVCGGMSAGSIASLSVYLTAYYAYIIPIFLPIVVYNYWVAEFDRAILATMFLLFVVMLSISAKINNYLLNRIFRLSKEKETLIDDLQKLSITDPLTGLYNRRYFEMVLQQEWDKAGRNHYPLILISIDVDNFKLINDNLGHPFGDHFLIYIANLLKQNFRRASDVICRIGGDEFSIILNNQTINESLCLCQSFNQKFNTNKSKEHPIMDKITLSMGIVSSQFNSQLQTENLVNFADEALYQAKKEGKNKMIIKDLDSGYGNTSSP